MREAPQCPACGSVAFETGPGGLCPRCVMQRMMADGPPSSPADPADLSTETGMFDGRTIAVGSIGHLATYPFHAGHAPAGIGVAVATRGESACFGDYELLGVLGGGGMGIVHSARQISLDRSVAIKMTRQDVLIGEGELRRFRNEALAVAQLDHPGIVPIYEVGVVEGRPFFSMKRIDGGTLHDRLKSFVGDPRAAASTMAAIAEAVHHAHVRGILHRDLKPANILIDGEGRPVVTDFGLAKRIEGDDEQTQHGAILGTANYMSPEQASGQYGSVTTASDIYGLGAILYAMLVGRSPFNGSSVLDTLQLVRNRPVDPPRKVKADVPRDLETICLKCLDKDPNRRYTSAQALADDLRHWLDGKPITARPSGRAERFAKWCGRNPAVAGLAAALLVAVAAGSAGFARKGMEVRRQRDQLLAANVKLDEELKKSRVIETLFVENLMNFAYPTDRDVTVVELLDRMAKGAGAAYDGQPMLEAAVRRVIGDALRAMGRLDEAQTQLERVIALHESMPPGRELDRLCSMHMMAALRHDQGRLDEALSQAESVLEGRRQILGPTHEETLFTANLVAGILDSQGRPQEAEALLRPLSGPARQALGPVNPASTLTDCNLAGLALRQGRVEEAGEQIRDAIARLNLTKPEPVRLLASARNNLGGVLLRSSRSEEAEMQFQAALDWARGTLPPDHAIVRLFRKNLGKTMLDRGKIDETERLLDDAGDIDDIDTIDLRSTLASALAARGEFDRAEPILRRIVSWNRRQGPDGLGRSLLKLAGTQAELRRWDDAIESATEALAILEASGDEADLAEGRSLLDRCRLESGRPGEAAPAIEREEITPPRALGPADPCGL